MGSYHYHCGDYSAHLHTNGLCPYKQNTSQQSTPTINKNKKSEELENKKVESIKIIGSITELNINDKLKLDVKIYPEEIKDIDLTWNSSDSSIATVDDFGNITAKSVGTVTIKVIVNNILSDNIILKVNASIISNVKTPTTTSKIVEQNSETDDTSSVLLGGGIIVGIIGIGAYLYHKKHK